MGIRLWVSKAENIWCQLDCIRCCISECGTSIINSDVRNSRFHMNLFVNNSKLQNSNHIPPSQWVMPYCRSMFLILKYFVLISQHHKIVGRRWGRVYLVQSASSKEGFISIRVAHECPFRFWLSLWKRLYNLLGQPVPGSYRPLCFFYMFKLKKQNKKNSKWWIVCSNFAKILKT